MAWELILDGSISAHAGASTLYDRMPGGMVGEDAAFMRLRRRLIYLGYRMGSTPLRSTIAWRADGGVQPAEPREPEGQQNVGYELEQVLPRHAKVAPAWIGLGQRHTHPKTRGSLLDR